MPRASLFNMRYLKYLLQGIKPRNFYYISSISINDALNKRYPDYENKVHIKAAADWLSLAQKQNNDCGVSAMYSLFEGWAPSYVETTGYIIPTFFNYADFSKNNMYREEAVQMADFELRNQTQSGGFPGSNKDIPIVFLTALAKQEEEKIRDGSIGGHLLAKPITTERLIECIKKYAK